MRKRHLLVAVLATPLAWPFLAPAQEVGGNPHGDEALDCARCHTAEGWTPVESPPGFDHQETGFPLEEAHAQVGCRDCHRSLVFARVGTACADCHRDAHRGELGFRCDACHTPRTWSAQREMFERHSRTRFPLFAVHANVDCESCHRGQQPGEYATTPTECGECHLQSYQNASNPDHVRLGFSRQCEECHPPLSRTWRGAAFAHTTFPLTGGHAGVDCEACHTGATYEGTPRDCAACHLDRYEAATNPDHSRFPTRCEDCHTTSAWRPASFTDHSLTGFPLTGAHQFVDCALCHEGGRYTGTPTDCVACHRDDYDRTSNPNHRSAGFPTACQTCHSTSGWTPARFDHDRFFPIDSGRHRGIDCSECHVNPGNYRVFECINCHEHSRARMDDEHDDVSGYRYDSPSCYRCHPRGVAEDD